MFDTSFQFALIQKRPSSDIDILFEHVYQFRTQHRRYIVIAEEYDFNIYVVKFYPADRKRDVNKFSLILNEFDFPPIVRTCVNIMLSIWESNSLASFGYVGANSITNQFIEPKVETQRFRIYEYVMNLFLTPKHFERVYNRANSAVLLINTQNKDIESFKEKAVEMFTSIYLDLEAD